MTDLFKNLLIVSDIDGTLLNRENIIPERNINAIKYFINNGGNFTIASARGVKSADRFFKELNLKIPTILCNGALIFDFNNNKIISQEILPENSTEYVKEIKEKFPEIGIEIVSGEKQYLLNINGNGNENVMNFIKANHFKFENSNLNDIEKNWTKVVFICNDDILISLDDFCKEKKYDDVYLTPTASFLYEMMPKRSNKGFGVKNLCEYLNIDINNTYAIGDYYNDLEMLTIAGHGVTVENAPQEVKSLCEFVVGDFNNGAIADLIEIIDKEYNKQ